MTAWVFGKLPAHGDFVARGMDAPTRGKLDDWLAAAMEAGRARYPDDFADRFDVAPPWRAEGKGVAGAVAASQDAVGRRFPLLLLTDGAQHDSAACEELLYAAITEGWDADRLSAVGAPPCEPVARWFGAERTLDGARPVELIAGMLA
ncbi:type VI secretion system-associated protein TagF [uncultured Sphingomonas sp.]|uniref:type VI secretion system-associated protein TagF n=1 Tax=uncultured Sphingomonas sp. TaxID=158754 RepID=UPI0025DF8223|nr:type VI secretion system-associated protein TagF [uncultured Sphingomonas sp.]